MEICPFLLIMHLIDKGIIFMLFRFLFKSIFKIKYFKEVIICLDIP
ncbi:protein of unknown function [Clostridium beijerinckii]|nr:protein of unknown function [Clostridium beijerinckii]